MKFTDFKDFKNDFKRFIEIASKGENIIVTKSGKPFLSLSSIDKEDVEDFLITKHYKLDKKVRNLSQKLISHREVKKHLGF